MTSLLAALALALAPAAAPEAAASPARADAGPALHLAEASTPGLSSLALPGLALGGLGAAALLLSRRRRARAGLVQVLETTALGATRSLVVARLGDELLLLGASEAGIALLRTQPAGELARAASDAVAAQLRPAPEPAPEPGAPGRGVMGLVGRLRAPRNGAGQAMGFEALLAESAEDQELRRKLARGVAGSVR